MLPPFSAGTKYSALTELMWHPRQHFVLHYCSLNMACFVFSDAVCKTRLKTCYIFPFNRPSSLLQCVTLCDYDMNKIRNVFMLPCLSWQVVFMISPLCWWSPGNLSSLISLWIF